MFVFKIEVVKLKRSLEMFINSFSKCFSKFFQKKTQQRVRAKNLGANFEHFWVANWPQFTNKCENIDITILLNAGTLAQGVTNWPPKFARVVKT
jgi:acyl carrier protein phosphodiesterase